MDEAGWRRVHGLAIPIIMLSFQEKKASEKLMVCKMRTCCFRTVFFYVFILEGS